MRKRRWRRAAAPAFQSRRGFRATGASGIGAPSRACTPPVTAYASKPLSLSQCATRTLVASRSQVQARTIARVPRQFVEAARNLVGRDTDCVCKLDRVVLVRGARRRAPRRPRGAGAPRAGEIRSDERLTADGMWYRRVGVDTLRPERLAVEPLERLPVLPDRCEDVDHDRAVGAGVHLVRRVRRNRPRVPRP